MRVGLFAAAAASLAQAGPSLAQTDGANPMHKTSALTRDDVRRVAPALDRYAQDTLQGKLWRRPDLSPRDRSIVTLSALIARNQTVELPFYVDRALDDGVRRGARRAGGGQ